LVAEIINDLSLNMAGDAAAAAAANIIVGHDAGVPGLNVDADGGEDNIPIVPIVPGVGEVPVPAPAVPQPNAVKVHCNAKRFDAETDSVNEGKAWLAHLIMCATLAGINKVMWGILILSLLEISITYTVTSWG
jgi:hypothetical protein